MAHVSKKFKGLLVCGIALTFLMGTVALAEGPVADAPAENNAEQIDHNTRENPDRAADDILNHEKGSSDETLRQNGVETRESRDVRDSVLKSDSTAADEAAVESAKGAADTSVFQDMSGTDQNAKVSAVEKGQGTTWRNAGVDANAKIIEKALGSDVKADLEVYGNDSAARNRAERVAEALIPKEAEGKISGEVIKGMLKDGGRYYNVEHESLFGRKADKCLTDFSGKDEGKADYNLGQIYDAAATGAEKGENKSQIRTDMEQALGNAIHEEDPNAPKLGAEELAQRVDELRENCGL